MSKNQKADKTQIEKATAPNREQAKPTARRSMGRRIIGTAAVLVLVFVVWKIYADRAVWQSALQDGTFGPLFATGEDAARVVAKQAPFQVQNVTIPKSEIFSGGPPKDGIPALTDPKLLAADAAAYLNATDRVIGVVIGTEARAYPLKILDHHEIVNARIGNALVAVTYCPLCDSCVVFDRRTELGQREFGVSGLLYNSNVLMFDRGGQPESLWSQVLTKGISGPGAGKSLKTLPLELTTWEDWRLRYPSTKVLSTDTGYRRDYSHSPYGPYFKTQQLMFPVNRANARLPTKTRVLGVWSGTAARAYPESAFSRERLRIEDTLNGKKVVIEFNPKSKSLRIAEAEDGVQWMYSLWFAWYAMRPKTDVFTP